MPPMTCMALCATFGQASVTIFLVSRMYRRVRPGSSPASTARAVDAGEEPRRTRRYIRETKKIVTEACPKVAHNAMQVMGGIGYTDVYPVERHVRDLRLASIWTGTNEVMSMIIAHEWYTEYAERHARKAPWRDWEADVVNAEDSAEKIYE